MTTGIFNDMPIANSSKVIASTPAMNKEGIQVKEAIAAHNVQNDGDITQFSTKKHERRGLIKSLKYGIANVKKFFASGAFGIYADIDPERLLKRLDQKYESNPRVKREREKRHR